MIFIQPSLKRLSVELHCSTVKIVDENVNQSNSWCSTEQFHLSSSNALNNISSSSSILLLPLHLQHYLHLSMSCSQSGWIYSSYLLALKPNSLRSSSSFSEEFLSNFCSSHRSNFSMFIEANSLPSGHYRLYVTIYNIHSHQLQDYLQPIEIIRSEFHKKLNDHQTIIHNGDVIKLDFLSKTDLKNAQRLNFTLVCYPQTNEKILFPPHGLRLGLSRPNSFTKLIPWNNFHLILHRPDLHFSFYEHQCLSSVDQSHSFIIDPETRQLNINEEAFLLTDRTLHFDLIMRYLIDGRVLITRRTLNKRIENHLNATKLKTIEYNITDLDQLIQHDPKHAIEVVGDLIEKLNEISLNSVNSSELDEMNRKEKNDRMSLVSKLEKSRIENNELVDRFDRECYHRLIRF